MTSDAMARFKSVDRMANTAGASTMEYRSGPLLWITLPHIVRIWLSDSVGASVTSARECEDGSFGELPLTRRDATLHHSNKIARHG